MLTNRTNPLIIMKRLLRNTFQTEITDSSIQNVIMPATEIKMMQT